MCTSNVFINNLIVVFFLSDVSDSLSKIADLEFVNSKLTDRNTKLEGQLEASEESNILLSNELSDVKKKYQRCVLQICKAA